MGWQMNRQTGRHPKGRSSGKGGQGSDSEAFARGMRQFNSRRFWHAHESWEVIWLVAPEPEKTFLQGIIQISAAFYHHQRKNRVGTRSLLLRGLSKVEGFPANHRRLRLEELRRTVREWLEELERGRSCSRKRYPKLRPWKEPHPATGGAGRAGIIRSASGRSGTGRR